MSEITRIVCPVGFSEPSRHAIDYAAVLARWYDAPILALRVDTALGAPVPAFVSSAQLAAHGKSATAILQFAAVHHMDVIVTGVDGRSALDQAVFGSTTNQVIRAATCPVVTLRRERSAS
jgi:nucleotide-binding universal stress UspA family protein